MEDEDKKGQENQNHENENAIVPSQCNAKVPVPDVGVRRALIPERKTRTVHNCWKELFAVQHRPDSALPPGNPGKLKGTRDEGGADHKTGWEHQSTFL